MKLGTFFEKFGQFADAPDAVAKMRELVLELSATGRLIPEVLERPVEEDTKLMGTIAELVMGQAPAGDEYNTEGRGTVFVKVGEFGPLYPREEVWTTNPLKFAKKGDVLVCVVGATVGKLNLAIDCAIGRSAAAIRPSAALDTRFLYYSLIPYTLRLRRNSRGSAQGVIGKAELNAVSLWVPSREVQKRIVAKVDELMALCDRLALQQQERETRHAALARASLARFADAPTPANLPFLFHPSYSIPPADLRKSILTLAVQGKLVPQDLTEEPAEHFSGRNKELNAEAPFEIPQQWTWNYLSQLADINGGFAFKSTAYTEKGMRVIRISDFDEFGFKDHKVVRHPFSSDLQKFTLAKQNILMAMTGGTVGKSYFARSLPEPMVVNQRVATIKVSANADPSYVDVAIRSEMTQDVIRIAKNSTNDNISMEDIKDFAIPLPPLAEQRRIVAKVEQLMALVNALETQLAASRATSANLLCALVAELTGTPNNGKVSVPSVSTAGRRGRPPKS
jgi:type I restriction enzyme S subunit